MWLETLSSISILFLSVSSDKVRYDNYTLYKVLPKNLDQMKMLQDLKNSGREYEFWNEPVPPTKYVNILSRPEMRNVLETFLKECKINFVITLRNIQELIDKEPKKHYTRTKTGTMEWNSYYTLDEIYNWLDDLAAKYDFVSIINGGETYEGQVIKGIKISHEIGRKAIFIESGIHAREWIAPATVTYVINELLTSEDERTIAAAYGFDWHIFPVVNPDGYAYSHITNRLWRKNRRPLGKNYGVDLNRNWNNNWLTAKTANPHTVSETYAGPKPFSELETNSLATYIRSLEGEIDLYLSFHSYGQILLLPFGNTTEPLANYHDALKIGRRALKALAVRHGTQYTIGNVAEAIYFSTGSSMDWVKERLRVPLVYGYELRDRGTYGHLLPVDQIVPTAEETMDSILAIIRQGKKFGYMSSGNSLKVTVLLTINVVGVLI